MLSKFIFLYDKANFNLRIIIFGIVVESLDSLYLRFFCVCEKKKTLGAVTILDNCVYNTGYLPLYKVRGCALFFLLYSQT